ncbi:MAG TPA: hypothetical protein PLA68_05395 [Panacibacter sp.]|nr:hypothetical protein [Panacibacter sp.]
MYYELSKREKKIAKAAIDKGVNAEFKAGLEKAEAIIAEWRKNNVENREAYHKLFLAVEEQDKRIANRYDGLGGSRYLFTVACILYDGQITEEDIKDFSEETKEQLNSWVAFFRRS